MEVESVQPEEPQTSEPIVPAAPISNRFLFVDIAALRAKQLRRGARVRLDQSADHHPTPHKAERVAMEEVRRRLVQYDLPPPKSGIKVEESD
jgi:DNA-directed RNA polymerase subunit K/omega